LGGDSRNHEEKAYKEGGEDASRGEDPKKKIEGEVHPSETAPKKVAAANTAEARGEKDTKNRAKRVFFPSGRTAQILQKERRGKHQMQPKRPGGGELWRNLRNKWRPKRKSVEGDLRSSNAEGSGRLRGRSFQKEIGNKERGSRRKALGRRRRVLEEEEGKLYITKADRFARKAAFQGSTSKRG